MILPPPKEITIIDAVHNALVIYAERIYVLNEKSRKVTGEYNGKDRNKCPNRSMEVELLVLLGNYDLQTDRPTKPTDRRGHREGILPTTLQQEKKGTYYR